MNRKPAPKPQGDIVFGIHPVQEILKAKRRKVFAIYTTQPTPKAWSKIEALLVSRPVAIQYVDREVLHRMAETTDHQGVVALVQPFAFRVKPFDSTKHPFLILLDGVQDPRNLGAIIRSAYCTGASGLLLPRKQSAPLTGAAIKASAGLAEHLEIMQVPSPIAAVQELKSQGYHIYLAAFDGKSPLKMDFEYPLCLVIGNEGEGITPALRSAGEHITLPQRNGDISYNASVAAGILLFLIGTQKGAI